VLWLQTNKKAYESLAWLSDPLSQTTLSSRVRWLAVLEKVTLAKITHLW
jgi:hypothetical protein